MRDYAEEWSRNNALKHDTRGCNPNPSALSPQLKDCPKEPESPEGFPYHQHCSRQDRFAIYNTGLESQSGYGHMYTIGTKINQNLQLYWRVLATYFRSKQNVVGYDLINEAVQANSFKQPIDSLWPGKLESRFLQPLYQLLARIIRDEAQDEFTSIYFMPTFDMLPIGGGVSLPTGFKESPDQYRKESSAALDLSVFNEHTYCCAADLTACVEKTQYEPKLAKADECLRFHVDRIERRNKEAKALRLALVITEFRSCTNSKDYAKEIQSVTDVCNQNLIGWSYWQYKNFDHFTSIVPADGGSGGQGYYETEGPSKTNPTYQIHKVKALARTTITSYQGTPTYIEFYKGYFHSKFVCDASIQKPSELYI